MRTDKITWFLDLAQRCAEQGTCLRRNYGAVIVDANGMVVSTGYTGAPCGECDCLDLGVCWREQHNIPPGSNYEKCRSVHAEMNALIQAGKKAIGSVLYLAGIDAKTGALIDAGPPCFLCTKMVVNSRILKIVARKMDGHVEYTPHDAYLVRAQEAFG